MSPLGEQGLEVAGGLRHVNIGGGFGIPYFSSDPRLDLAVVGESLQGPVDKVRAAHPGAEVIVELGRYLVGESGYYVTRVVDRKVSRGQVYLVTDKGERKATGSYYTPDYIVQYIVELATPAATGTP